jgi:hypothetical protein
MQRLTLRAAILQLLVWKWDLIAALRGHLQGKGAKLACHPRGADESRERWWWGTILDEGGYSHGFL